MESSTINSLDPQEQTISVSLAPFSFTYSSSGEHRQK